MTDAIFGASGFIGSHLAKRLPDAVRVGQHAIHVGPIDRCFYLAAYGNMAYHDDLNEMARANVGRMLRYQQDSNYMLYTSSSSVLLPVQTPYSRTKRAAEEILQALGKPCAIVQLFSVVGVGEQEQHLIPTLIRSCFTGEPVKFVPAPTHDFIDVSEVCYDIMYLADARETGIYEIGNGTPVSNMEVLEIVERVTGRKANTELTSSAARAYDSSAWYARDPFRRHAHKKSLTQSIAEMVEAYRNAH